MYDHDNGHDQGHDVDKVVGDLEDEGIRNLDRPRIALGLNADAIIDILVTHKSA